MGEIPFIRWNNCTWQGASQGSPSWMSHPFAGSPVSGPCKVGSPLGSPVIGPYMVVSPLGSPVIGPYMVVSPPVSPVIGPFTGPYSGGSPQGAVWGLYFPVASAATRSSGGAPSKSAATHSSGGAPSKPAATRSSGGAPSKPAATHSTRDHFRGVASPGRYRLRSESEIKKTGYTQDSQKNQSEIQELNEINAKIQELKKFHADLQPVFEEFRTKSHDLNGVKDDTQSKIDDIHSKIDNIYKIWDTSFGNNREIVDIGEFQNQSNEYLEKTEEVVQEVLVYLESRSS